MEHDGVVNVSKVPSGFSEDIASFTTFSINGDIYHLRLFLQWRRQK